MSKNQIGVRDHFLPSVSQEKGTPQIRVFVEDEKRNDGKYSLISRPDQDTEIRIVPDDREKEYPAAGGGIIAADFAEHIPQMERLYYSASLSCGLLAGALSEASSVFSGFDFDGAASFETPDQSDEKGKDFQKVLRCLSSSDKNRAAGRLHDPFAGVPGEEAELSAAPSSSGLLFSLLSQFTGMLYFADDKGGLREQPVPDHYVTGDSREDKILAGILYWLFHASVISARRGRDAVKDMEIPGPLSDVVGDILSLCDFSGVQDDFKDAETRYSEWLGRLVIRDREDDAEGMELFFLLREKMRRVSPHTFPVVLSNCLVRAAYILCRIRSEAAVLPAPSFEDLLSIDLDKILPRDHRILSNMCLVSAGTFAAVSIGHAALRARFRSEDRPKDIKDRPEDKKSRDFISAVTVAGTGTFRIALAENTGAAGENIEILFTDAG